MSQRTENSPAAPPRQQHQGRALSPLVTVLHKPRLDTQSTLSTSRGGQRRNSTFPFLLPYPSSAFSPSMAQAEQQCLGMAGVAAGTRGPLQACHLSHHITLLFPGQRARPWALCHRTPSAQPRDSRQRQEHPSSVREHRAGGPAAGTEERGSGLGSHPDTPRQKCPSDHCSCSHQQLQKVSSPHSELHPSHFS